MSPTKKDPQLSEISKKVDSLIQVTESHQSYLEAMNTLLGRLVFPNDQLIDIVMKYKKTPEKYLKAYNLCDGKLTQAKIAEMSEIDPGQLSRSMTDWKEMGIVYEISKKGGKFYKRLYKLEPKPSRKAPTEESTEGPQPKPEEPSLNAEIEKLE